jgi:hypothetical protein
VLTKILKYSNLNSNERKYREIIMQSSYQAIFDATGTIFGVGKNIKEAIIEANDWLAPEKKIKKATDLGTITDFKDGSYTKSIFSCDCTPEFAALVLKNEGKITWAENRDGLLDVAP